MTHLLDFTYAKLRSAFTAVRPSTEDAFWELISSVFAGDDYWANQRDAFYFEPEFEDAAQPLRRFLEQEPAISQVKFTMQKADFDDRQLMQYAEQALTKSRGHLLSINYVMAWFFLSNFNLLPRCLYGNSREKVLDYFKSPEGEVLPPTFFLSNYFDHAYKEEFESTPIVLCGALRPSELLDRARGFTSAVVFPYRCMEWNENHQLCAVSAYLIEFPDSIEPVITDDELLGRLSEFWEHFE